MRASITETAFDAAIRDMRLRPSAPGSRVYLDEQDEVHHVKDPTTMTGEERAEYIALKRYHLGQGPKPDIKPVDWRGEPLTPEQPIQPGRPPMI